MVYRVRAGYLDARPTAVVRGRMPADQVAGWVAKAFRLVAEELARQGVQPQGPPFARYTRTPERIEVEAGYPVSEPIDDHEDVIASGLPGGPAVIGDYVGRPERIGPAYAELSGWLRGHGFDAAGPHWESYLAGPEDGLGAPPTDWHIEMFVPYRWGS